MKTLGFFDSFTRGKSFFLVIVCWMWLCEEETKYNTWYYSRCTRNSHQTLFTLYLWANQKKECKTDSGKYHCFIKDLLDLYISNIRRKDFRSLSVVRLSGSRYLPPWMLYRGGPESSGWILINLNRKRKRRYIYIYFFIIFFF